MQRCQNRVDDFNVSAWQEQQSRHPARPIRQARPTQDTSHLHNPYAGCHYAWQLTETVEAFLKRLPPERTIQSSTTPWIFICNPFIQRQTQGESGSKGRGNENEAPVEPESNVQMVIDGGLARLELVTALVNRINATSKSVTMKEREISKERQTAVADLLHLAHAHKVRAGKVIIIVPRVFRANIDQWMLFCPPQVVDETWEIVAKATAGNELGIASKVAPKNEMEDLRRDRLICVYTSDFHDKADVGRVLQKLRELKLVEPKGRPIYYKPGAWSQT